MSKLIEVKALENFTLFVKYSDGVEGKISLNHLRNNPEFNFINDFKIFSEVNIDSDTNDILWKGETTLCKNAVYKQVELRNMMKSFQIDIEKL